MTIEELTGPTSTGIPVGVTMEELSPAVPADLLMPAVKSEHDRAVNPDFCGAKYDELHGTTTKNIQKVMQQWPAKRRDHEVQIEKGKTHPMCKDSEPLKQAEVFVAAAVK